MQTLAPSEHTNGGGKVVGYSHWMVYKHIPLQGTDRSYEHIPVMVIDVSGTAIMGNVPVISDQKY